MNSFYHEIRAMIHYLINHVTLQHRIYASFIAATIVIVAIILITYTVFARTDRDLHDFITSSKQSHIDLQFTAQVAELHRLALTYTHEGHRSAADQVTHSYQNLMQQIDHTLQHDSPPVKTILATIKRRLESYYVAFLQLRQQRDLRQQLINVEFRKNANNVEALINQLLEDSSNSLAVQLEFKSILNTLLLVEKNVFRYLDSLNASYITAAKHSLNQVVDRLHALNESENSSNSTIHQALHKLDQYQQSYIEAVQHTRGYLYLINVVMAAEAYEINFQSKKLSTLITNEMRSKEEAIHNSQTEALNILVISASLLLGLLIALSYCVGQSISIPIMRLTETFRQLTNGSGNAKIFNYPVVDEISELSQAAAAFRDKNTQTEKLLTRSIQLAQALEKNRIALERSNDELEQFVYTVSHDLKAPLVTSMGFIGIIRKLADQGKYDQAIQKLDKVTLSIERMGQLTNDLLELSRIGRIDVDMKKIDLYILLQQLAQSQQEQLQSAGLQFIVQRQLPVIVGNESRILQLFENILSNAIKYVRNSEQAPMLEIGSVADQNHHLIYCKDNGPGIELAFQQKVFALFHRLDTQPEGTGIGLTIAKKVMRSHGGDIWIESSGGKGTIFWLKFPIFDKEAEETEDGL